MLKTFSDAEKESFLESNPLPQDRLSKLKNDAGLVLPEIYQCARRGAIPADLERIRALLTEAIDNEASQHPVNRRCPSTGRNLLHEAATFGHKSIIDMLCEDFGADVGARTLMGNDTPLHFAASKGHRAICFWLITVYGADPNATNKYNWTPLHYACQYSSISVVKCICRYGGRTIHKTDDGDTPIMLAIRRGASEQLIDFLAKTSEEQERNKFRDDVEGRRREQQELAAIRDKEAAGTREAIEKRFLDEQRAEYEKWRHGGELGAFYYIITKIILLFGALSVQPLMVLCDRLNLLFPRDARPFRTHADPFCKCPRIVSSLPFCADKMMSIFTSTHWLRQNANKDFRFCKMVV